METLINTEFEAYFLGSCLVETQIFVDINLSRTGFGTVDHQPIYAAIRTVHEEHGKTDALLVADQLKKSGELNRAGGYDTIYGMQATDREASLIDERSKLLDLLSAEKEEKRALMPPLEEKNRESKGWLLRLIGAR